MNMSRSTVSRRLTELRVVDLKNELDKRQLDKNGNKATLFSRLHAALINEGQDPEMFSFDVPDYAARRLKKEREGGIGEHEEDEEDDDSMSMETMETYEISPVKSEQLGVSAIRSLWISGISNTTRAADLKTLFSQYGTVELAKIVTHAKSPGSQCFGYIRMSSADEAVECIQRLHLSEFMGKVISIDEAVNEKVTPLKIPIGQNDKKAASSESSANRDTNSACKGEAGTNESVVKEMEELAHLALNREDGHETKSAPSESIHATSTVETTPMMNAIRIEITKQGPDQEWIEFFEDQCVECIRDVMRLEVVILHVL
ncbi:Scaffold attachment factor B1 [Trichinella pseudospiralis]|uniref:Scaffold attachment factor B1 n=1 Tax=Trichinella pseudospiralis TaxID=6337 RepID=A0A0V0YEY2_TRIPS|nr:Scaffold attachment factor B1 [Trichinella pseudospiralis]